MRGSDGMQETLFTVAKLQTIRKRIEEHFGWGKTIRADCMELIRKAGRKANA